MTASRSQRGSEKEDLVDGGATGGESLVVINLPVGSLFSHQWHSKDGERSGRKYVNL